MAHVASVQSSATERFLLLLPLVGDTSVGLPGLVMHAGVAVGVLVGVNVRVGVLVGVNVRVGVLVGVNVRVGVLVGVKVRVGVLDGVAVEVAVCVGELVTTLMLPPVADAAMSNPLRFANSVKVKFTGALPMLLPLKWIVASTPLLPFATGTVGLN